MKTIYTLVALLALVSAGFAQTISGVVTDENGESMPGVAVQVVALSKGVRTDLDGKFTLELPVGTHKVEVSSMSYAKQVKEIILAAGENKKLDFKMLPDEVTLDNIVIVGYGVERNRPSTGSVSKIGSEQITSTRTPSFESALQGQAPGLQVSQSSGMAGAGSLVRIRGAASISAGGDPLYIIDGIPMTNDYFLRGNSGAYNNNPLSGINPADIESIEIRKDAAAAGEYGSRGANGVILITTKRAKEKGWKFDFSANTGFANAASLPDMLNTKEYLTLRQEAWVNDDGTGYSWLPNLTTEEDDAETRKAAYLNAMKTDTDWIEKTVGTGTKYGANFGARYGSEKFNTYFSVGYDDNASYLLGNSYRRMSARINPEFKISSKLKANFSLSATRGINNRVDAAWSGGLGDAMSNALPYYPVTHTDTLFNDDATVGALPGDYYFWKDEFGNTKNPVAYQEQIDWTNVEDRMITTGRIIWMPKKDLFVIATGGQDYMWIRENKLTPAIFDLANGNGSAWTGSKAVRNFSYNITAEYSKNLNEKLRASILVGHELQRSSTLDFGESVNGLDSSVVDLSDVDFTITPSQASNPSLFAFVGAFAKINLAFSNKYFIDGTFRTDGSSRFGENNAFGSFPSLSAGWIISEEKFLAESRTISFMKLRTSWGITGNSNIQPNARYSLYSADNNNIFYNNQPIIFPTQQGNPNLKWESTSTFGIALETGLWNDRLTIVLEGYRKYSTDVLMQVNIPASTGFSSYWDNVAEIENKGIELSITMNWLRSNTSSWKTMANFAYNYNELVSIGDYTPDAVSGGTNDSRVIPGSPVGSFYLVEFSHVDPENGLPVYIDLEGNETYDYDNSIRKYVGDGLPDMVGGVTNTFTYKNWTLGSLFTYSIGGKIFDSSSKRQLGVVSGWNMRTEIFDRWQQPGDESTYPILTLDETTYGLDSGFPWWNTSLFVYDASYVRLRNLSLDYNLPREWFDNKMFMNVGVFVNNLFTITNFPGLDPEVVRDFENMQDRNLSPNVTYLTPPQERSYNLRINANF